MLRLWEQVGEDGALRVRLPKEMNVTEAQPCDLRGQVKGDPIPIRDHEIEVPLTHFVPVSLILMPTRDAL